MRNCGWQKCAKPSLAKLRKLCKLGSGTSISFLKQILAHTHTVTHTHKQTHRATAQIKYLQEATLQFEMSVRPFVQLNFFRRNIIFFSTSIQNISLKIFFYTFSNAHPAINMRFSAKESDHGQKTKWGRVSPYFQSRFWKVW